nr:unnamed protein product [Callosobruchus analis]
MEKKPSITKQKMDVSATLSKQGSTKDDHLVVIKERGLMTEINSGIDAATYLNKNYTSDIEDETAERYSGYSADERGRKSVKIDGQGKIHPIVPSSSQLIIEENAVQVEGEDEFVSFLFGFQSASEVQHFRESIYPPSPTTSFGLNTDSLLHDNMTSIQSAGIRSSASESKTDCPYFKNIVAFSETFVDNIIQEAEVNNTGAESPEITKAADEHSRYNSEDSRFAFQIRERTFTGWPSIAEFNSGLGAEKIDEYLASFKTEEDWFYAVYYNGISYDGWSSIFHYEVKWSLPTPRYPIVQATATMYFDIEVSLTIPLHCKVKVTYWYEGNNFRFDPEVTEFNDFTLNHILDKKIKWFQTVTY